MHIIAYRRITVKRRPHSDQYLCLRGSATFGMKPVSGTGGRPYSRRTSFSSCHANAARLNAARKLLTTTEKSVADIAVEVGFFDQSHFIKAFKRERGTTPGRYRRQFWQG